LRFYGITYIIYAPKISKLQRIDFAKLKFKKAIIKTKMLKINENSSKINMKLIKTYQ